MNGNRIVITGLGATTPVGHLVVETGSAVSQTVRDLGVQAQRPGKLPKLP